ncbi:hypothetical protein BKH43_06515 [Helicobacter sp. 13S00401-1]|uniref:hypothetical protein n=1 Tax=Helicobacter sp. 13S00401-1 TaxID=1905758 RepID=UPI000BA6B152|nr:hypothetical protein [Helicobacter sp. 13S00401-1]PAF49656.1 hypothetical protein BKH43_06515 [Helicobacter sp. 13S00401-1]
MDVYHLRYLLSLTFKKIMPIRPIKQLRSFVEDLGVLIVQKRYKKTLALLAAKKRLRVLFLVNESSKWKMKSLYDLLAQSDLFEPLVVLTPLTSVHKSKEGDIGYLDSELLYFKKENINIIYAYKDKKYLSLKELRPDIVFYEQPWELARNQAPLYTSKFALTYYMPYYVSNYGNLNLDINLRFHKFLYRYYVLNHDWKELYKKHAKVDNFCPIGHTQLDNFYLNASTSKQSYVIYAPHYSFPHVKNLNPVNYATFLQNHRLILDFAKKHSNLNWVFKPHPKLKASLLKSGFSKEYVEGYYKQWEAIGISSYNSDYIKFFLDSKALITDSGSFLIEYFCTTKPLIHLLPTYPLPPPFSPSKKIFDTFYKAYDDVSLLGYLESILLKDKDPLKEIRLKVLKESGLNNGLVAERILKDLKHILKGERK